MQSTGAVVVCAVALIVLACAGAGVSAETHDEAIASVASEGLFGAEHAESFAELAATADTNDVFGVLDAISDNIAAEQKHAKTFYESYKKTTARDLKKYRALIAKTDSKKIKRSIRVSRAEQKAQRQTVNDNVRRLSRAVARFHSVKGEAKRTTHKKKAAMRHLNNKISDRRVYLKVLKSIRKALKKNGDNQTPQFRFAEALKAAHSNGMTSANGPAFLQLSETQAIGETTDNSDEAEADAAVDEEAFELDNAPTDADMTEVEESNEDEAVAFLEIAEEDEDEAEDEEEEESEDEEADEEEEEESDEAENESEDEAEADEESEEDSQADEAEGEAEAEDEVDDGASERMMQVLETLAVSSKSSTTDDHSVSELLSLVEELIVDVKASIHAAEKRKVEVIAKYTKQMKSLETLSSSIKSSIQRLQAAVHAGRARLAEREHHEHSLELSLKDADSQAASYREMHKAIKANWKKYEKRYRKNAAKRERQLEKLNELKRRLAAVQRDGGAKIDVSNVQLRYRWKAYPFSKCAAPCGPSKRTRKVVCLSFSGAVVKHSFCAGQKKPKKEIKCQRKMCPLNCVVSEWKASGKCSNACGTGVKLFTRKVQEPARFGGQCPKAARLTRHMPCSSKRGCPKDAAKSAAAAAMVKKSSVDAPAPASQGKAGKRHHKRRHHAKKHHKRHHKRAHKPRRHHKRHHKRNHKRRHHRRHHKKQQQQKQQAAPGAPVPATPAPVADSGSSDSSPEVQINSRSL